MRATHWIFPLAVITLLAVVTAPALADDGGQAQIDKGVGTGDPPDAIPATSNSPEPIPRGCTVSRNCAYPPPATVSCTSDIDDCSEGSDGYGWVECDGVRYSCSGPSCSGSGSYCKTNSDCSYPYPCTCGQGICSTTFDCVCPLGPPPT